MKISLTVGIMKDREGKKPVQVSFTFTTAYWPTETFHQYDWYRAMIKIPDNMGRPKIMGWRKIIHQEEKT